MSTIFDVGFDFVERSIDRFGFSVCQKKNQVILIEQFIFPEPAFSMLTSSLVISPFTASRAWSKQLMAEIR